MDLAAVQAYASLHDSGSDSGSDSGWEDDEANMHRDSSAAGFSDIAAAAAAAAVQDDEATAEGQGEKSDDSESDDSEADESEKLKKEAGEVKGEGDDAAANAGDSSKMAQTIEKAATGGQKRAAGTIGGSCATSATPGDQTQAVSSIGGSSIPMGSGHNVEAISQTDRPQQQPEADGNATDSSSDWNDSSSEDGDGEVQTKPSQAQAEGGSDEEGGGGGAGWVPPMSKNETLPGELCIVTLPQCALPCDSRDAALGEPGAE